MIELARRVRSVLGLLLALSTFPLGFLPFYLFFAPLSWLRPAWRPRLISIFMKGMSAGMLAGLRVGGARFRREGRLPTRDPMLIVGNHQSLIDICTAVLLAQPYAPAFVTRSRYARHIPLVSACVRMIGCPIVDPLRDRGGAIEVIRRGARDLGRGLLIFPEGHRSLDGELRAFKRAGIHAALEERPMPVYLLVNDGLWRARRLVDCVFRVHLLDADTRVIGPLLPPEGVDELDAFVASLGDRIAEELEKMRSASA